MWRTAVARVVICAKNVCDTNYFVCGENALTNLPPSLNFLHTIVKQASAKCLNH